MSRDVNTYVPIHVTIARHRKTRFLAAMLQVPIPHAVGLVTMLLCEAAQMFPDGRIGKRTATLETYLADLLEWKGDRSALLDALVHCGQLDADGDDLTVHDFDEYIGRSLEKRGKKNARMRQYRDKLRDQDRGDTSSRAVTVPARVPDRDGTVAATFATRATEGKGREGKEREEREGARARTLNPHLSKPRTPYGMGRGAFGLDEKSRAPQTPEEYLERHGERLRKKFPMLDGRGERPDLLSRVTALWADYENNLETKGERVTDARLEGWLAKDARDHKRSWEMDGSPSEEITRQVAASAYVVSDPYLEQQDRENEHAAAMALVGDRGDP